MGGSGYYRKGYQLRIGPRTFTCDKKTVLHVTTKLRPVFDASSKEKNQLSLNDCLQKGENLIELIP